MLTEQGFYRPNYEEIVSSMSQKAKELLGEDIDVSELSVLGKFIRIIAYDLAETYQTLENTYYARFPNTANGVSLDRLAVFAGISRNPATASRHNIKVFGESGTTIGMGGLLVGTEDNITFYNENDFTIGEDGTATVIVTAVEVGTSGNVNSITNIVNPVANISSISYIGLEEAGEDVESDVDLRKRFSTAVNGAGSCNMDAIIGYVSRIQGVESVSIVDNHTSFETYVYGGDGLEQEIAEAILLKKPIGIKAISTADSDHKVTKIIKDVGGTEHTISFSKVKEVTIDINVSIKTNNNYTTDGAAAIKNNLVKYVNSLGVGSSVVTSAMYGKIFEIDGVSEVVNITQAKSGGTHSTATIDCLQSEIPITTATNIIVNVVS